MVHYDLIIIGKGISACAAIISLFESGNRIAVLAPENNNKFKIGETLSPSANKELKKLGLYQDFLNEGHLKAYSSFSSWGKEQLSEKYVWEGKQEAGWYIDRSKFETFLWSKALKTNMDCINDKLIYANLENNLWHLNTKKGNKYKANYILDCSGRSAVVLRNFNSRKRIDKLVAIYAVLDPYNNEVDPTIASLVEPTKNGWFYSSIIPTNQLVVAYFTDSDLIPDGVTKKIKTWKQLLDSSEFTMKRIDTAEFKINQLPIITDASTIISDESKIDRLLSAGDAIASFDPLSSHGMTTALWSGRKAAKAFKGLKNNSTIELERYHKALYSGIQLYRKEKKQIYAMEKRFSKYLFWKRRQE